MLPLFADLYAFTMLRAYRELGMTETAAFSLFVRKLPPRRNYLIACGLADALAEIEAYRFGPQELDHLRALGIFPEDLLAELRRFRFGGSIHAVPEGTPVFAGEPLVEVIAPIAEAQMLEAFLMNQISLQTILATKASRVVRAAAGRSVIDFGSRRAQGSDAALAGARAFSIAGVAATSNVLAGQRYGIPVAGTMAHSFVEACAGETQAFLHFARLYPGTTLLLDTFDTVEAARKVVALAAAHSEVASIRAVRLDSGDLAHLSREVRSILDSGGLSHVRIFASGGLDEDAVAALVSAGAPIDAFGVGTAMSVSEDAPSLDIAYKLTEYAGLGRMKLSAGKRTLPHRKQVFREVRDGSARGDVIALVDEELAGTALIIPVMADGRRLPAADPGLDRIRGHARDELARLPAHVLSNDEADPPYPVRVSAALLQREQDLMARLAAGKGEQ